MSQPTNRKSRILGEVHETATGLHQTGVISKRCMHEHNALSHLAVPAWGASRVKMIRENSKLSQAAFAAVISTSVSTVQNWELGEKRQRSFAEVAEPD